MELLLHLSTEIRQKIYDEDREYSFEARIDGENVVIDTDLPVERVMLYTERKVSSAVINCAEGGTKPHIFYEGDEL